MNGRRNFNVPIAQNKSQEMLSPFLMEEQIPDELGYLELPR